MERKNGYIVIDDWKKIKRKINGEFAKGWFTDGINEYIYKMGLTELERYKELFYALIIRELGLKSPENDLAKRKNSLGIISKNYNPKHNESYMLEEILPNNQKYNLRDLPNEIAKFCIQKDWKYSLENIKENLLTQFIIQIILGNWDLESRNMEIEYDKEKKETLFSPFYDFTFYGYIDFYNKEECYAFCDQNYNNIKERKAKNSFENFLNHASSSEIELLKMYFEKFKRISLTKNIRTIGEKTEKEVPIEIKYELIKNTEKCFGEVEEYIRKRGLI